MVSEVSSGMGCILKKTCIKMHRLSNPLFHTKENVNHIIDYNFKKYKTIQRLIKCL